jgi:hypothetical protein
METDCDVPVMKVAHPESAMPSAATAAIEDIFTMPCPVESWLDHDSRS